MTQTESYEHVRGALADTAGEAASMQAKTKLMRQIVDIINKNGWKQAEVAQRCGVTQPRMNDLLRGRISRFSLDALVNIAASMGQKVHIAFEAA